MLPTITASASAPPTTTPTWRAPRSGDPEIVDRGPQSVQQMGAQNRHRQEIEHRHTGPAEARDQIVVGMTGGLGGAGEGRAGEGPGSHGEVEDVEHDEQAAGPAR